MESVVSIVLAFIVAFSATPIAKKVAFKIGAVDVPKDNRRMHSRPIALFGGAAIAVGFIVSILYSILSNDKLLDQTNEIWGLLAGMAIIIAMGVLDDILTLRAWQKLLFQIAAASVFILVSGITVERVSIPFSGKTLELAGFISYPISFLWIIGITNAFNFIDGLDGLAAGIASISSLSLFFVSILSTNLQSPYITMVTAALAGSTLGFLPFNFNPAKIFMGETGSAFLGFTLGVISLQGTMKSFAAMSIAIPVLALGLPLFDTTFAIVRRVLKGQSPMQADRGHLHHRLMDLGLSQKQSVMTMYVASAALGLCAIVLASNKGVFSAVILLIAVSIFVIGGARFMSEMSDKNEPENEAVVEEAASSEQHTGTDPKADINSDVNIPVAQVKKLHNP